MNKIRSFLGKEKSITDTDSVKPKQAQKKKLSSNAKFNKKVEQADATRHTGTEASSRIIIENKLLGELEIKAVFENKSEAKKCLKVVKVAIIDIQRELNKITKETNQEDARHILGVVDMQLKRVKDTPNFTMHNKILERLVENSEGFTIKDLREGLEETLSNLTFIAKKTEKQVGGFLKKITTRSPKQHESVSISRLESDLQCAIKNGDLRGVRKIIEQRGKDVKTLSLNKLSELAIDAKEKGSKYVLQLLVNKNLLRVDGLDSKLEEAIIYAKNNHQIGMSKLLTNLKSGIPNKKLCVDIPSFKEDVEINSDENIEQLGNYIARNRLSKIEKMIESGQVDLRDLNDDQLFNLLMKAKDTINSDTMYLLSGNGFDISKENIEKYFLKQAIETSNTTIVKYLMRNIKKSNPTLKQHLNRQELISRVKIITKSQNISSIKREKADEIYSILKKRFKQSSKIYKLWDSLEKIQRGDVTEITGNLPKSKTIDLSKEDSDVHFKILQNSLKRFKGDDILEYLNNIGINFSVKDSTTKTTVLMLAVKQGDTEMVEWLLNKLNAELFINDPDNEGHTALDFVETHGKDSILESMLVQHGAHKSQRDNYKQKPTGTNEGITKL